MTRDVTVQVGGSAMAITVAEPAGAGPHPGMVVIHHREGIDEFTRAVCERLAKNGFTAAAPNLFHHRPAGEDTRESRRSLNDGQVVADIDATIAWLQGQKSVRGDRIGIIGHCMGGRMSYLGAASN
ncbi:MAG TPA: dienelactone hydrolase family protein, partial [Stellaceae bacterium]|nr:dienelactone hydrolase family protein [Stellaceae bacterium]